MLDADTMATVRNVRGQTGPRPPATVRADGLVWTVDGATNRLIATNPLSHRVFRDVTVGTEPVAVAIGFGAAWVANAGNGSVTRVPLGSDKIETIGLTDQPSAIATGAGAVWVLSERGDRVIRIDPADKQVTKSVHLANPPLTVVARAGRVYLTIGD